MRHKGKFLTLFCMTQNKRSAYGVANDFDIPEAVKGRVITVLADLVACARPNRKLLDPS